MRILLAIGLILAAIIISRPATAFDLYDYDSDDFLVIGDAGKDNQGQHDVALAMLDVCARENCDFGIYAGDVVYQEGVKSASDPILERMFDKYYNPLNIKFLMALGNHDYGLLSFKWRRGSYQLLHAHRNPNFHLPHYWYTYETDHAVYAVIDTTRMMWKKDISVQAAMTEIAFERAKAQGKWFIVTGHHPYLSNGKHGNAGRYEGLKLPFFVAGKYVKRFLDRHVCGKADFYLAGHEHSLQVFDGNVRGCDTQLIVSGSAASATKIINRNPAEFAESTLGFFHLTLDRLNARVRAYGKDSSVLFEKVYLKTR